MRFKRVARILDCLAGPPVSKPRSYRSSAPRAYFKEVASPTTWVDDEQAKKRECWALFSRADFYLRDKVDEIWSQAVQRGWIRPSPPELLLQRFYGKITHKRLG